ncbi:MAG: hypothetical protein HY905_18495 [Deltaproteobacteria bacterium]|nr:hypothetical protein [Deltaproteobacteria bacterium]
MRGFAVREALAMLALASLAGCGSGERLLGAADGGDGSSSEAEASPPPPEDGGLGETGWRDSTEPWVPPEPARENERGCDAFDVWSNDAAVYVLLDWYDTDGGPPFDVGQQVLANDGSGWRDFYDVRSTSAGSCDGLGCIAGIAGMIDGRLVSGRGALAYVGPAGYAVEGGVSGTVEGVFVVNDSLAYAIWHSGGARVIRWDGSTWGPVTAVLPYESVGYIWADADHVFVVGQDGNVLSLEGGTWRIHDAGTLNSVIAVWGFSGDDVWIATHASELRHFDGTSWTPIEWPFPPDPSDRCREYGIHGLWGADGVLFVWTDNRVAEWDGSAFRSLGHWPATTEVVGDVTYCHGGLWISDAWGNSPTEFFVAAHENLDEADRRCPDSYLLYWDGTVFHWF